MRREDLVALLVSQGAASIVSSPLAAEGALDHEVRPIDESHFALAFVLARGEWATCGGVLVAAAGACLSLFDRGDDAGFFFRAGDEVHDLCPLFAFRWSIYDIMSFDSQEGNAITRRMRPCRCGDIRRR